MDERLIERIERESGVPGLVGLLAERLSPTDLASLWMAVAEQRAAQRTPAALLSDWEKDRFVRPSATSPQRLNAWERTALSALPDGFEALALAPVCPLGTVSTVSGLSQHLAVATARGTEVVSDSTNVLALECAFRRRALLKRDPKSTMAVHLAAAHRLLRPQQYKDPNALAHFAAFALCSAGRDTGHLAFELSALSLHVAFYITALRAYLGAEAALHVSVTPLDPELSGAIETRVFTPLRAIHAGVAFAFDLERARGRGYYRDVCFHVHLESPSGDLIELADGGSVPWTQTLLSNAKERLFISGIGSERVAGF